MMAVGEFVRSKAKYVSGWFTNLKSATELRSTPRNCGPTETKESVAACMKLNSLGTKRGQDTIRNLQHAKRLPPNPGCEVAAIDPDRKWAMFPGGNRR
jgi:hypothetical protein